MLLSRHAPRSFMGPLCAEMLLLEFRTLSALLFCWVLPPQLHIKEDWELWSGRLDGFIRLYVYIETYTTTPYQMENRISGDQVCRDILLDCSIEKLLKPKNFRVTKTHSATKTGQFCGSVQDRASSHAVCSRPIWQPTRNPFLENLSIDCTQLVLARRVQVYMYVPQYIARLSLQPPGQFRI